MSHSIVLAYCIFFLAFSSLTNVSERAHIIVAEKVPEAKY